MLPSTRLFAPRSNLACVRRHPTLGVLYECIEVEDLGDDVDHPGNRGIAIHTAMHLPDGVHVLTLRRSVTASRLEELRRGLSQ